MTRTAKHDFGTLFYRLVIDGTDPIDYDDKSLADVKRIAERTGITTGVRVYEGTYFRNGSRVINELRFEA